MLKVGSRLKRLTLVTLGSLATALGIIGVWVPGLPTTVFLLIAVWAFSQSSSRFHGWLYSLPLLKTAMLQVDLFIAHKTVSRSTKVISQSSAWLSAAMSLLLFESWIIRGLLIVAAASCSLFMWKVGTHEVSRADRLIEPDA